MIIHRLLVLNVSFFFFNDTATTEIYTLSLHDALPIFRASAAKRYPPWPVPACAPDPDRKSTRLNSSHGYISYAVFCLKKKKVRMKVGIRHIEHQGVRKRDEELRLR